jgi:citrate lyase synthetase
VTIVVAIQVRTNQWLKANGSSLGPIISKVIVSEPSPGAVIPSSIINGLILFILCRIGTRIMMFYEVEMEKFFDVRFSKIRADKIHRFMIDNIGQH